MQESTHIYINAGLLPLLSQNPIAILEVGFGTGLNAFLTYLHAGEHTSIFYETVEAYPLESSIYTLLNYPQQLQKNALHPLFLQLHTCPWNEAVKIDTNFTIFKQNIALSLFEPHTTYNLVYFDSFDPVTQPDLWSTDIFRRIRHCMHQYAKLVTYSSKSSIRKSLREAGFEVQKLQGPPGKREFIVATAI